MNAAPHTPTEIEELPLFLERRRLLVPDRHGDPLEGMSNLFDVAILIGVAMLVFALSSFGLREILGTKDVTIVKNPGSAQMEIITKTNGRIERLKSTGVEASGKGAAIGTVYRLDGGQVIWVPGSGEPTSTP
jgi:hypothetical protein